MGSASRTEPEAGHRHRAEVEPESFHTQGVRSRFKSRDLNEPAVPAGLFPNSSRIAAPNLFPIKEDSRPTDGLLTENLDSHRIIRPVRCDFDPVRIPPDDTVQAIGNRFIGIGNLDPIRWSLIFSIGMGDDIRRQSKESTISAKDIHFHR